MPPSKGSTGPARDQAVATVVSRIKQMIVSGEILPGQQIRQEQMAATLGVSRLPVREGLHQLAADGLVTHEHNVGFAVARLSRAEFGQVYLMRRLLETEVLRGLERPDADALASITQLAEEVEAAAADVDLTRMREANSRFHLAVFALSGLDLVVAEIGRIWNWALPYHAVSLYDPAGRERILAEHRGMLSALESGDAERLVVLMDDHRAGSEAQLDVVLAAGVAAHASSA